MGFGLYIGTGARTAGSGVCEIDSLKGFEAAEE